MSTYNLPVVLDLVKHPKPFIERNIMLRKERTPDMQDLMNNEWNYVFVYGTLKQGYSNHRVIPEGAKYLGRGHTRAENFRMYTTGGFPVVEKLDSETVGHVVYGEVYAVKANAFIGLDALESNGYMYQREKVQIKLLDQRFTNSDGSFVPYVPCWMYIGMDRHWNDFKHLTVIDHSLEEGTAKSGLHFLKTRRVAEVAS